MGLAKTAFLTMVAIMAVNLRLLERSRDRHSGKDDYVPPPVPRKLRRDPSAGLSSTLIWSKIGRPSASHSARYCSKDAGLPVPGLSSFPNSKPHRGQTSYEGAPSRSS